MTGQSHRSDPRILNRRTLERDHPRLQHFLRPGMSVLDVGCGTGAITAGIARAVGPEGHVLGVDRDDSLLALARDEHQSVRNLRFENGDALSLPFEGVFDVISAARTLQWIAEPEVALTRMKHAAKSGGHVVALDYNHEKNSWDPDPPMEFTHFYKAFLDWRTANHWNNLMADLLPDLFRSQGLRDVQIYVEDQIATRGDPDFFDAAAIWTHVIQTLGPRMAAEGLLSESGCRDAETHYEHWVQSRLQKQTLQMRTVVGRIP